MDFPRVDRQDLTAYFDPTSRLTHVIYRGSMTAKMTIDVYRWIIDFANHLAESERKKVRGSIYDFREVTGFSDYSISTVQRESKQLNFNLDVSKIPVALLVESMMQENMIRVAMKVTAQEYRKRIVFSEEEALAFFEEFHASLASQNDE